MECSFSAGIAKDYWGTLLVILDGPGEARRFTHGPTQALLNTTRFWRWAMLHPARVHSAALVAKCALSCPNYCSSTACLCARMPVCECSACLLPARLLLQQDLCPSLRPSGLAGSALPSPVRLMWPIRPEFVQNTLPRLPDGLKSKHQSPPPLFQSHVGLHLLPSLFLFVPRSWGSYVALFPRRYRKPWRPLYRVILSSAHTVRPLQPAITLFPRHPSAPHYCPGRATLRPPTLQMPSCRYLRLYGGRLISNQTCDFPYISSTRILISRLARALPPFQDFVDIASSILVRSYHGLAPRVTTP
ncbi:hypothetical protein BU16DRAFT_64398 [Lophium mytilinum]|uniref:Uncharacterized protein n=1 Tax=Lophium mytilinum TaxID=390894 RepID=A0A6A6QPL7_9PEZI|nr:hypothetical protein BU16DRAFT_64398 [Lophium mytilinum]